MNYIVSFFFSEKKLREKVELQIGIAVSAYNGTALQMGKKALLAVVCSF